MDSITFYRTHAVHKSFLRYHLQNSFVMPPTITTKYLSQYHLLYWNPVHLLLNMKDGTITKDGRVYQVIFQDCNPFTIKRCNQVVLSFRAAKVEFDLEPYVIVKPGNP